MNIFACHLLLCGFLNQQHYYDIYTTNPHNSVKASIDTIDSYRWKSVWPVMFQLIDSPFEGVGMFIKTNKFGMSMDQFVFKKKTEIGPIFCNVFVLFCLVCQEREKTNWGYYPTTFVHPNGSTKSVRCRHRLPNEDDLVITSKIIIQKSVIIITMCSK